MGSTQKNLQARAKHLLRKIAAAGARLVLQAGSKPYNLIETTTVVIAPHQDDETLGCGGLIARKRSDGLPVHVIFITDGSASHLQHPQLSPREIAGLRRQEAMHAMAQLGVERLAVHFLDEPDGTLKNIPPDRREDLIKRLAALLRELAPTEVFLPCNPDGSSEHDATFGFVLDALALAHVHPVLWQYPVWAWWNPVLLVRCWLTAKDCRRVPMEDYLPAKRKALIAYQSQVSPIPPEVTPVLPPELTKNFLNGTEFFFRGRLPEPPPPTKP
jgi:N-acetylglucosamine malate deacetylase 1